MRGGPRQGAPRASPAHGVPPRAAPTAAWRALVLPIFGLALVAGRRRLHLRRSPAPPAADPPGARAPRPEPAAGRDDARPPPVEAPPPIAPPPEIADAALRAASAADADRETATRLSERLQARAPLTAEDVRAAEDLFGRYPVPARDLLEAVLIGAAAGHREGRRYDAAAALIERARAVAPESPRGPKALLALRLETSDWASAESAARDLLVRVPSDAEAARSLAYALVRQDRSREAIDLLAELPRPGPRPGDPRAPGAVPARPGLGGLTRRGTPRPLPRALRRGRARGRRP